MNNSNFDFLNYNQKKVFLILAHPDDEVIFANSILKRVHKTIICYQDIPNENLISKGRHQAAQNYPLTNFLQLGLVQSRFSYKTINWKNPSETKFGLKGYLNKNDYEKNYKLLFDKLSKILTKDSVVITHNPWGEYGHPEHIQVNRVISELSLKKNFEFFVTGFVSTSTLDYARLLINRLGSEFIKYETDFELYQSIKKLYSENGCWTWFNQSIQNKHEIFYKQINNDTNDKQSKIKINQIPLYIINDGNSFTRNLIHIIKIFLPRSIKKILRNIKFQNAK